MGALLGVESWNLSSRVLATLSDSETSGGFRTCVIKTEEVSTLCVRNVYLFFLSYIRFTCTQT